MYISAHQHTISLSHTHTPKNTHSHTHSWLLAAVYICYMYANMLNKFDNMKSIVLMLYNFHEIKVNFYQLGKTNIYTYFLWGGFLRNSSGLLLTVPKSGELALPAEDLAKETPLPPLPRPDMFSFSKIAQRMTSRKSTRSL